MDKVKALSCGYMAQDPVGSYRILRGGRTDNHLLELQLVDLFVLKNIVDDNLL